MNKRKIALLAMSACMIAILAIGGTLAYFTDTDAETNVFTIGNVEIDLVENFDEKNNTLKPGVENKLTKEVWIENIGTEPAYVWYEWLIPAALDSTDGSTGTNNNLHVNSNGNTWDKYREDTKYWDKDQTAALDEKLTWDHDPEVELGLKPGPEGYYGQYTDENGIVYNKYLVLYHGIVDPEGKTTVAMNGAYLDKGIDFDGTNYVDKNGKVIEYDFDKNIKIIVNAFGIQAAGLDDVYAAYNAYHAQVK